MGDRRPGRLKISPGGILGNSTLRLEGMQAVKVRFGIEAGEVGEEEETAQDWGFLVRGLFPCGRFVAKTAVTSRRKRRSG